MDLGQFMKDGIKKMSEGKRHIAFFLIRVFRVISGGYGSLFGLLGLHFLVVIPMVTKRGCVTLFVIALFR